VKPRTTCDNECMNTPLDDNALIADTTAWLNRAVIGLNLCPFAKAVHTKQQIRYVVSHATTPDALMQDLLRELDHLADVSPEMTDTTLLIHPQVLSDFLDFNDFLEAADAAVEELGLEGVLQVASFHPQFQFSDTEADDITNYTNRSPYPTLHLLREESVTRAVEAFPEAETIYKKNIATLRKLGHAGWDALMKDEGK
jgi:uncharacterized protein